MAWSGGKDAAWTLHTLRQEGCVEVVGLLTTLTEGFDRISMQGIRRDVLHAQAEVAGLPVLESWIPQQADNTTYETAFANTLAEAQARWPGIQDIAFGDLLLTDVRDWRNALCARHGWQTHYPLFGADTNTLARDMIAGGLRASLCCVDTRQLDARFAGRHFDFDLLAELPCDIDPCGEHGEFHTCVYAGPMFARPLTLNQGETTLRDQRFAYTDWVLAS
ncbi:Dph6-related ATP pyrophosphatase [Solilutibacter tolerans]|uniref:MJ0570-related uncharacterized domain-containing protein n=1 Tax=Solilutibacter tolerans TaxID=1604334 RepID=A0A1N6QQC9_9GAMM|nr:ATP-binding protein [Lysobacter tolerans]SIQ18797.1 MJ0570-related uncharacterized domain-containing protein [Lysobacter tolerans]